MNAREYLDTLEKSTRERMVQLRAAISPHTHPGFKEVVDDGFSYVILAEDNELNEEILMLKMSVKDQNIVIEYPAFSIDDDLYDWFEFEYQLRTGKPAELDEEILVIPNDHPIDDLLFAELAYKLTKDQLINYIKIVRE